MRNLYRFLINDCDVKREWIEENLIDDHGILIRDPKKSPLYLIIHQSMANLSKDQKIVLSSELKARTPHITLQCLDLGEIEKKDDHERFEFVSKHFKEVLLFEEGLANTPEHFLNDPTCERAMNEWEDHSCFYWEHSVGRKTTQGNKSIRHSPSDFCASLKREKKEVVLGFGIFSTMRSPLLGIIGGDRHPGIIQSDEMKAAQKIDRNRLKKATELGVYRAAPSHGLTPWLWSKNQLNADVMKKAPALLARKGLGEDILLGRHDPIILNTKGVEQFEVKLISAVKKHRRAKGWPIQDGRDCLVPDEKHQKFKASGDDFLSDEEQTDTDTDGEEDLEESEEEDDDDDDDDEEEEVDHDVAMTDIPQATQPSPANVPPPAHEPEQSQDKENKPKKKIKNPSFESLYSKKVALVTWDIIRILLQEFDFAKGEEIYERMQGSQKDEVNRILNYWINRHSGSNESVDVAVIPWHCLLETLQARGWRRTIHGFGTFDNWLTTKMARYNKYKSIYESKVHRKRNTRKDDEEWNKRVKKYDWLMGAECSRKDQKEKYDQKVKRDLILFGVCCLWTVYYLHTLLEPIAQKSELRAAVSPKKGSVPVFNWTDCIVRALEAELFLKILPYFVNWGRYKTEKDDAFIEKMKQDTESHKKDKRIRRKTWTDVCEGDMARVQQVNFRSRNYTKTKAREPRDVDSLRECWRMIKDHFQHPKIYAKRLKRRVSFYCVSTLPKTKQKQNTLQYEAFEIFGDLNPMQIKMIASFFNHLVVKTFQSELVLQQLSLKSLISETEKYIVSLTPNKTNKTGQFAQHHAKWGRYATNIDYNSDPWLLDTEESKQGISFTKQFIASPFSSTPRFNHPKRVHFQRETGSFNKRSSFTQR